MRRWQRVKKKRPRRWWPVWAWHTVVVLLNLSLAATLLIVLPAAFDIDLRAFFLFAPDISWLNVISAGIALLWCIIRTALMIRNDRAFGGSVAPMT